jgi:hypothetical protein
VKLVLGEEEVELFFLPLLHDGQLVAAVLARVAGGLIEQKVLSMAFGFEKP